MLKVLGRVILTESDMNMFCEVTRAAAGASTAARYHVTTPPQIKCNLTKIHFRFIFAPFVFNLFVTKKVKFQLARAGAQRDRLTRR